MKHLDEDKFVEWVERYSFCNDQRMREMLQSLRECWVKEEQIGDRLSELLDKISASCQSESSSIRNILGSPQSVGLRPKFGNPAFPGCDGYDPTICPRCGGKSGGWSKSYSPDPYYCEKCEGDGVRDICNQSRNDDVQKNNIAYHRGENNALRVVGDQLGIKIHTYQNVKSALAALQSAANVDGPFRWAHIWDTPKGEFVHIYSSRPADLPGAKICRVRIVEVDDD